MKCPINNSPITGPCATADCSWHRPDADTNCAHQQLISGKSLTRVLDMTESEVADTLRSTLIKLEATVFLDGLAERHGHKQRITATRCGTCGSLLGDRRTSAILDDLTYEWCSRTCYALKPASVIRVESMAKCSIGKVIVAALDRWSMVDAAARLEIPLNIFETLCARYMGTELPRGARASSSKLFRRCTEVPDNWVYLAVDLLPAPTESLSCEVASSISGAGHLLQLLER